MGEDVGEDRERGVGAAGERGVGDLGGWRGEAGVGSGAAGRALASSCCMYCFLRTRLSSATSSMLSELSPSSGSSSGNAMAEEPTVLSQWCRHDDESTEAMGLLCIASAQTSDLLACSCGSWLLLLPPGAPPGSPEAHMKQFTSSSARLAPNSLFIRPNCGLEERPLHAEPEVVRVWGRGTPAQFGSRASRHVRAEGRRGAHPHALGVHLPR